MSALLDDHGIAVGRDAEHVGQVEGAATGVSRLRIQGEVIEVHANDSVASELVGDRDC